MKGNPRSPILIVEQELALRVGPTLGGLLNATVSNAIRLYGAHGLTDCSLETPSN